MALLASLALALATLTVVQSATASAAAVDPPFTVRPGTTQLEVLDATTLEGDQLELVRDGSVVDTGTVDSQGSLMWRQIRAGSYTVRTTSPAPAFESAPAQVTGFGAAPPDQSFYSGQTLHAGLNFIETRDGTTLSANVVLPNRPGPYPTVVEYSGYDPSNPRETAFPTLFTLMGYAYVGVNIRGTGCSGGSFLPFEPVQSLDGYDAIEAVAAQSWVKGKVGMVGISYPGIEQLYVARTTPPHLAAITPLSVIDDTYRGTLWPGGILNTGFADPVGDRPRTPGRAVRRGMGARPRPGQPRPQRDLRRQPAGPAPEPRPGLPDRGQPVLQQDLLPTDRPEPLRPRHQRARLHRGGVAGRADRRALPGVPQALQPLAARLRDDEQRLPHRGAQPG